MATTTTAHMSEKTNNYSNLLTANDLAELKILHFLLLLFTQFLSVDKIFYLGSIKNFLDSNNLETSASGNGGDSDQNTNSNNPSSLTIIYCFRKIAQLIDQTPCSDKLIKTKILLNVSEF